MLIEPPQTLVSLLAKFDAKAGALELYDVERSLRACVVDKETLSPASRRAVWAELAAFGFRTHDAPNGGPWKTYFQPCMTGEGTDGKAWYAPNLQDADADVLAYWSDRARNAKHPAMIARYADLVWDTARFITKDRPSIEFARLAIDSYIAASRVDDGSAWSDSRVGLGRALELAISVADQSRTAAAVTANIDYVDRTSEDDKIGTYCYLFERLLPGDKGPPITPEQERALVGKFESIFASMIAPDSKWFNDPHGPQSVGQLLADYYRRKGLANERTKVLREIARAFERRAKIGDALAGVLFLDRARRTYLEAGLRVEAERVQREAQDLGPEAAKCMAPITTETTIKKADVEEFLNGMMDGGLDKAINRFALEFMPRQQQVREWIKEKDSKFFAHKIFPMTKMAHGHIVAKIDDDTSDPDGPMVYETAHLMQFSAPWIHWTLDRMIQAGFSTAHAMAFIEQSQIFESNRHSLIARGVESHLRGDFVQAVHVLVPQIEHAIRTLFHLLGKPTNKAHGTGRGVMQFKGLNDFLPKDEWPDSGEHGEDLRMYLRAVLAHPKGANIRNEVAHGVYPGEAFTQVASERVLHVLLALATIRLTSGPKSERQA